MEILVWVFLVAAVAAIVLNIWCALNARRTDSLILRRDHDAVAELVISSFSRVTWATVGGPGDINRRLRTPVFGGPIISVDLGARESGTQVDIWMSGWTGILGGANYSPLAYWKKRKICRALGA